MKIIKLLLLILLLWIWVILSLVMLVTIIPTILMGLCGYGDQWMRIGDGLTTAIKGLKYE